MPDEADKIKDEETRIRARLNKRYQEWQGFAIHGVVYLLVNLFLWLLWLGVNYKSIFTDAMLAVTNESFMHFLALPLPLIVTLAWGVGLAAHYVHYYIEYGPAADRHEARVQREIERYKEQIAAYEEPKNNERSHLELNDDGEIEEVYEDFEVRKRRRG